MSKKLTLSTTELGEILGVTVSIHRLKEIGIKPLFNTAENRNPNIDSRGTYWNAHEVGEIASKLAVHMLKNAIQFKNDLDDSEVE